MNSDVQTHFQGYRGDTAGCTRVLLRKRLSNWKDMLRWTTPGDPHTAGKSMSDYVNRAEAFAADPELLRFWSALDVSTNWDGAQLEEKIRSYGIEIPEGIAVRPLQRRGRPTPDFVPWTIVLSRCRTFYVAAEPGGKPKEETVCFGFELVEK